MKNVEIGPIRPPSESSSLLVRVTRGCHWNKCYFCGLYKSMQFSMRPIEETIEDIARQAQFYKGRNFTSCFLQDGDALVLKTDYLLRILDALNHHFPSLQYITTYARADSITRKTLSELQALLLVVKDFLIQFIKYSYLGHKARLGTCVRFPALIVLCFLMRSVQIAAFLLHQGKGQHTRQFFPEPVFHQLSYEVLLFSCPP